MRVFVAGYPGDVGGANTECWHTLRLWRRLGVDITLIPTWRADPAWQARLEHIGCRTVHAAPDTLARVDGLRRGVVASFCNSHFLRHAERFRDLGCRTVWVNCMTWLFAEERRHYRRHGPFDRYVFQSVYQEQELGPQLAKFGVGPQHCRRIRGAFCCEDFPFRPLAHRPGTPLVIGRLSRAAPDKFAADTWPLYARMGQPLRVRIMAWSPSVERKLGPPPPWAECLPAGAETPQQFLAGLHCMVQLNGGAAENWPRSGLEAMACGAAVVAENRWGWRELVRHGRTGYLADSPKEMIEHVDRLLRDDVLRLEMVREARRTLEEELAEPESIGAGWRQLFEELS